MSHRGKLGGFWERLPFFERKLREHRILPTSLNALVSGMMCSTVGSQPEDDVNPLGISVQKGGRHPDPGGIVGLWTILCQEFPSPGLTGDSTFLCARRLKSGFLLLMAESKLVLLEKSSRKQAAFKKCLSKDSLRCPLHMSDVCIPEGK